MSYFDETLCPHGGRKEKAGRTQEVLGSKTQTTPTPKITGDGATKAVVIFFSKNVHCTGGKESNDRK